MFVPSIQLAILFLFKGDSELIGFGVAFVSSIKVGRAYSGLSVSCRVLTCEIELVSRSVEFRCLFLWALWWHVVAFSVRMRKIFLFGAGGRCADSHVIVDCDPRPGLLRIGVI